MSTEIHDASMNDSSVSPAENLEVGGLFRSFLGRLREEVQHVYGERLVSLAVYGSVGRGTATAESDIDFIIVATDLPRGRLNRMAEFRQVERRLQEDLQRMEQWDIHTYLSPVIKSPETVLLRSPLFLDMIFDAVILYDKEDFFRNFLADFKARLDGLGAKRIFVGDQWYWDLKPDYKWGDIIEL
jgi:hypothetical protein